MALATAGDNQPAELTGDSWLAVDGSPTRVQIQQGNLALHRCTDRGVRTSGLFMQGRCDRCGICRSASVERLVPSTPEYSEWSIVSSRIEKIATLLMVMYESIERDLTLILHPSLHTIHPLASLYSVYHSVYSTRLDSTPDKTPLNTDRDDNTLEPRLARNPLVQIQILTPSSLVYHPHYTPTNQLAMYFCVCSEAVGTVASSLISMSCYKQPSIKRDPTIHIQNNDFIA